jgi:C-terminal processing protease CtpA/Prc
MNKDEERSFTFEFPEGGMGLFQGIGRGRLGIRVESLNPDLGEYFGVKDGRGALVLEVLKDTPAERAGLRAGDVITRVGDRAVYDADDLVRELRSLDGQVSLTAIRQGTRRTFEAELDKAPRTMRLHRDGIMGWGDDEGRVHIRSMPRQERDQMQREMEELRKELRELRRQIEELHRN